MHFVSKLFLIVAASSGALAVVLGAFGAHALKARLDQSALAVWQTAVQYHFFHTLALLVLVVLMQHGPKSTSLILSAAFFSLGLLLFSGSLYGLALGGPRWLGPVTPLGGTLFIAGWISLLIYGIRGQFHPL
jgi:uncharacterized membrane protein YgdD (TMEM256/DUF423 family)